MTLTPEQFNLLATKEDLQDLEMRLPTRASIDRLITTVDAMNKKLDSLETENTANTAAHDRFQGKIANHEHRIVHLETGPMAA